MITFPIWYSIPLIAALVAGGFAMAMVLMQKLPPDQREVVRLEIANRAMAQALRDAVYALESVVDPYLNPPYAPKRMCEVWEQIPVVRNVVWNVKFSCAEALARAAGVLGGDPLRRLDMEPVAAEGERRVPRG